VVWPAVYLDALVCLQVPYTDRAVAGASDALVFVELATVDAIRVAVQVDGSGSTSLPPLVDCASCRVHLLPFLRRGGLAVRLLSYAGATHQDRCGRNVDLRLIRAEEDVAPDVT
jgi:hypothetical protein